MELVASGIQGANFRVNCSRGQCRVTRMVVAASRSKSRSTCCEADDGECIEENGGLHFEGSVGGRSC